MEHKERLCKAIKKIAFGYVMLYFDINLGTLDILPSWLGYVLFLQAIKDGLSDEEDSTELLRPVGVLLGIYYAVVWALGIFNVQTDTYIVDEIIAVISLYFHFQLLTNLANIAGKYGCQQQKSILALRTVQTILLTALVFALYIEEYFELALIIGIVQVIVVMCICCVIFRFKKSLEKLPEEEFIEKVENQEVLC